MEQNINVTKTISNTAKAEASCVCVNNSTHANTRALLDEPLISKGRETCEKLRFSQLLK